MPRRYRVTVSAIDGTVIRTTVHYTRFGAGREAKRARTGSTDLPTGLRLLGYDVPPRQWDVNVDRYR